LARWHEFVAAAPEFAEAVLAIFDAHRHKTLATLRRDGSPRISGIEVNIENGELWLGAMWRSMKALDLQRDPRFALHSSSVDPPEDQLKWAGDAKISGRVEEITDPKRIEAINKPGEAAPPEPSHLFRADVQEVVLTRLGDPPDHLVIEFWSAARGLRRVERT
jgi:hypothetical protein